MKKKVFVKTLLSLTLALAIGLGFAGKAFGAFGASDFTFITTGDHTAGWSTDQQVVDEWSIKLYKDGTSGANSTAIQFVPTGTITLADFQADISGAPVYSFRHYYSTANGPQFELRFEDPNSTGWLEITAVGLQSTGGDSWATETLGTTTPAGYGGNTPDGSSVFEWGPLTALSGIEAAVNTAWDAAEDGTDASDYVLTRVRVELWEEAARTCYIDDIIINDVTYVVDDPVYNATREIYYNSIGAAIVGVATDDVIQLPPGTYNNDVESFPIQIDVAGVTLQSSGTAAETIIDATGDGVAIQIGGTPSTPVTTVGVTVDGFTVTATTGTPIFLAGADDAIIRNNVVNTSTSGGVGIDVSWYATGVTVSGNTLDEFGSLLVHGSDCTVSGNTVGRDIIVFPQEAQTIDSTVITNNTLPVLPSETVNGGIQLWGGESSGSAITNTLIEGNTIDNRNAAGLRIGSSYGSHLTIQNLTVTNNVITNNAADGIYINADVTWSTGNTINYNDFSGNTNYGINNLGDEVVDAKYNWWGDVSGPQHEGTNPNGTGNDVKDDVTYVPWLDDEFSVGGATGGIPVELTIISDLTVQVGAVVTIGDTLKDINGNLIDDEYIDYSLVGVGSILSATEMTDDNGYTSIDYLAGYLPGTATVRAELQSNTTVNATVTITVGVGPVAEVVISQVSDDSVIVLDNVTIVAGLQDAYGNHIDADTSKIDFTGGAGTIGEKSVTDSMKIQVVYTTDSTKIPGGETITARYLTTDTTDTAEIYTFGDQVAPDSLAFDAFSSRELVVGDSITFNVLAKDQHGNLTEDREITFTATHGTVDIKDTTNVDGEFTTDLKYYGGTAAQVVTLTANATDGDATEDTTIYLKAAGIDSISITGGTTVVAGETIELTFTYFDSSGNETDIGDTVFSNISAFGTLGATTTKDTVEGDIEISDDDLRAAVYGVLLLKDYTGSDTITVAAVDTIVAEAGSVVDTLFMNVVPSGALFAFDLVEADSYTDTSAAVGTFQTFTFIAEDSAGNRRYGYEDSVIVTLNNSAALDTQVIWQDVSEGGLVAAGDDTGFVVNAYFAAGKLELELYDELAEGGLTITVEDTVNIVELTSAAFGFKPADVDSLPITLADIDNIFAGREFEFTVTPEDEFGNENKTDEVEFYMSANWPDDFNLSGVPRTIKGSRTYKIISSIVREGQYLCTARASVNDVGIKNGYSPVFNVRSPDAIDPVVTITVPADSAKFNSFSVAVTGTVVDSSSVTLTVNGVAVDVDSTFSSTVTFAGEGDTVIYAEATDIFGNVGHKTVSITIDTTKPVFASLTPADGGVVYVAKPAISVNVTDALAGVDTASIIMKVGADTVVAPTLTAIAGGYTVAYTPTADLPSGLNIVTIEAADLAGTGNAAYDTTRFTVSVVETEEIVLAAGYNLVSVPVDPVVATTIGSIFPDAIAIYGYDDADYVVYSDTTLVPGMAFWVAYLTADTVDVVGYDVDEYTLDVVTGFNLVGALAATASFTDFEDPESVLVSGWLYGYNAATKAYEAATTLEPGKGYWVAATDTGTIELGAALLAKANAASVPMPEWVGRITVNDNIYSFGKAEAAVNAFDIYDVLMPPVAPGSENNSSYFENSSSPMFNRYMSDVRSEVGNWVFYIERGQKAIFDVSNIPAEFDVVTNIDGKQINLRKDNTIAASKAISIEVGVDLILPEKFVLYRNYPNPFNPTTNFKFDMPTAGHVSLEIYNVLGERVRSIVNTDLNAGRYQYQWDGTNDAGMNVTSGIYFYRIQAADHQKVMKMILMK